MCPQGSCRTLFLSMKNIGRPQLTQNTQARITVQAQQSIWKYWKNKVTFLRDPHQFGQKMTTQLRMNTTVDVVII